MKRLFKRTHINVVGSGSDWFDAGDKALVAQVEPNPTNEKRNIIVEYWLTQADKDADLAETLEQEKAETPRWPELEAYLRSLASPAKPAKAPEARAEAAKPEAKEYSHVLVFVRGPQNHWGFVKAVDEAGSYTLCTYPDHAFDFEENANARAAMRRMRAYEQRHYNWDNSFYVLKDVGHLKAERKPPETKPGEIAFMHRATAGANPGAPQEGNG